MPKPTSKPAFDSAHDPKGGQGLRLLASFLAITFLLLAGFSAAGEPAPRDTETEAQAERAQSTEPASELATAVKARIDGLGDGAVSEGLRRFYGERAWEPVWIRYTRMMNRPKLRDADVRELLDALTRAEGQGLTPADYVPAGLGQRVDDLPRRLGGMAPGELAELEVDLTRSFAAYANDLLHGRLSPSRVDDSWHLEPRTRELSAVLATALDDPRRVARTADRLEPDHDGYRRLKDAYDRYRGLAADGGWPEVPDGEVVKVGEAMEPERYRALVERLRAEGYLPPDLADRGLRHLERWRTEQEAGQESGEPAETQTATRTADGSGDAGEGEQATGGESLELTFDEELETALIRFQDSHGIREDGALGPNTLRELNVSAEDRARIIALNLERWRWLPDDLGERYVEVNLPAFTLEAVDGDRSSEEMRVVVGKDGWVTPVLTETMEHVVVNPYWNIPRSILEEDILPKLRENPSYLVEENMEVVDVGSGETVAVGAAELASGNYRVRQKPGPGNALGRIKFMFPNRHNVYLHDTPADYAFDRTYRDLSHGCVRVEHPIDLADFVFAGDSRWNGPEIEALIRSKEQRTIPLEREIPVYFLYWTAFVDDDGEVQFRPDLYGYDEKHTQALEGRQQTS